MSLRVPPLSTPAITTQHMKSFSLTCLEWAWKMENASNRQTIIKVAKGWLSIAQALDLRVASGGEVVNDLRSKLS